MIDAAEALAEAYLGKKVEVIATHPDCVFVVAEGEDCVRKLGIRMEADGPKVISNRVKDGLVTEANLDRYIGACISEAVDAFTRGEPCNQLHGIARFVHKNGRYLFSEERDALMETSKKPLHWEVLYEANRKDIRKMAYGTIREDENKVPKTRYGALPTDKVESFDSELRASMEALLGLAAEVSEGLKEVDPRNIDAKGWNAKNVLASMQTECSVILDRGNKALSLARKDHLPDLAEAHDRVADTVKSLLVMRRFIQASTIKGD